MPKEDRANQLINEKAEVQADGSLKISSENWREINHELNKGNIEKNKMFEDAIRNIANEDKTMENFWRVRYLIDTKKQEKTSDINLITSFEGKPKPEFLESGSMIQYSEYFNSSDEPVAYKKMQSFITSEFTEALKSLLEKRNINSKENFMSEEIENEGQARDPKEEAFLNTLHQRKVITDALKAGKLSCLPGEDGFADTQPAVNLVNGTFYHGTNLLFLKEHQKENDFPSAEYVTAGQIEKAQKDNPDLFIRKGQKGVSIYVSEKNDETGEWENKNFRLFNVAQTTKPAVMKEWAEQQRQEKLQEKLEYLQTQYGTGYQLPEPKQKGPGPEIVCSSTEPKEYLGQYLAAVSMGGKFKATSEQAAEFSKKLEGTLFERMENGHTNPFKLEKISIEASQHCKEVIKEVRMEARKAEQPQQEQTQSRGRGM